MNYSKSNLLSIVLLIASAISLVLYILYGWPLLLLLFLPGIFIKSPKKNFIDRFHCRNCQGIIDPNWKYCPFCSTKI